MRFFNLDLHIAVIADIKQILQTQGHQVTDWTLAALSRVFGRERDRVDIVNEHTWRGINPEMCDAFYKRYKEELAVYDGFIVTHTPCFAMLFERWQKPILTVASTRYEHPFSDKPEAWEAFNDFLRRMIDTGQVIPLANNHYDSDYAELFTGRKWPVIPSLCNYTGAQYTGSRRHSLLHSRYKGVPPFSKLVSRDKEFRVGRFITRVKKKLKIGSVARAYSWQDLADYRSIVHIPYQVSTMSIFEMYAAGIPMLFPTLRFALQLFEEHRDEGVFTELSYNQVKNLPPGSVIACGPEDPNRFDDVAIMSKWIAKADFYHSDMPGLTYFDSFDDLGSHLRSMDPRAAHEIIAAHHKLRTAAVHQAWAKVIDRLA